MIRKGLVVLAAGAMALTGGVASPAASLDDFSEAKQAFLKAAAGKDESAFEKALAAVVKDDSRRAVECVVAALDKLSLPRYWRVIEALGGLQRTEAVETLAESILDAKRDGGTRRDLVLALQLNRCDGALGPLLKLASEASPDIQVNVIDELVLRKAKAAVPVLIALVKREEKTESELWRQARRALVNLTGRDEGSGAAWSVWWEKSKETFEVGADPKPSDSNSTIVETIRRNRATEYEELKKGEKSFIAVLEGGYDRIEDVLWELKIPHSTIGQKTFDGEDLSRFGVILINCNASVLNKRGVERVRAYVASGGYLFTSDYELQHCLQNAFPGYVKARGDLPEMSVGIVPARGTTGHPYLKDVFVRAHSRNKEPDHRWVIDGGSYPIEYDEKRVTPLIDAAELRGKYKYTAIAVTFSYADGASTDPSMATGGVYEDLGKRKGGKVLHVLSHFVKQKDSGEYSLQNMLLNFLLEANEVRKLRKK